MDEKPKTNETNNLKLTIINVYGIDETRLSSGFPMMEEYDERAFFDNLNNYDTLTKADGRLERLAACKGGESHDCCLCGIVAQFNLSAPRYFWQEWQRYHFQDIVSSMSTMHRLKAFIVKAKAMFNAIKDEKTNEAYFNYVYQHFSAETDISMIDTFIRLASEILDTDENGEIIDKKYKQYIKSNLPEGFIITARITTNYRQLKTIYHQRHNHRLAEWRTFCNYYLSLFPHKKLIMGE